MICGMILAGGRSLRFGSEKALADLDGRPLIAWVADVILPNVDALAVTARAGSGAAAYASRCGYLVLGDNDDDPPGPLAGVMAGLRWAKIMSADWLCTAPCDTPHLPAVLVSRLAKHAGSQGSVARTSDGLQPLCALWPVSMLDTRDRWAGLTAPRAALAAIGAVEVDFEDASAFANLNTPQEYAAAEAAARALR